MDQGANVSIDLGQSSSLLNQIDQESLLKRNLADESLKQKLDDQKAQQEAAKRALAAMKAAQEAIVEQWRKDLDEAKASNDMTLAQEGKFWVQRMESARKGSLSYIAALNEANKDIARMRTENMHAQDQFDKTAKISPDSMDLSRSDTGAEKDQGRRRPISEDSQSGHLAAEGRCRRHRGAIASNGSVNRAHEQLGEAQALAALHAKAFADAQERIDEALAKAQNLPDGFFKQTTIEGLQDQRAHVAVQAQMQGAQDQQAVASQQLGPATRDALSKMVQTGHMTQSLVQIMGRSIDSLNDDLAKMVTGHGSRKDFGKLHRDWTGVGQDRIAGDGRPAPQGLWLRWGQE